MGVCMEVLIVDWDFLRSRPAGERDELVDVAAFGPDDVDLDDYDFDRREGWTWPDSPEDHWWARYEFRSTMTSYKAHFWAGERWDELRAFVDPTPRAAMDQFCAPLIWGEHNYGLLPADQPPFTPVVESHAGDWDPQTEVMLWLEPHEVATLLSFWAEVEPHLASLRGPFERHLVEPIGWIQDFASFSQLVSEWGDVVGRAAARGWAVIGLKC